VLIAQFHDCVEAGQGNHQAPTDKSKHSGACSFCQCCASLDIEPPPLITALTFPTPVAARAGGRLPSLSPPVQTFAETNRARAPPVKC
jgi:hypothetical protein